MPEPKRFLWIFCRRHPDELVKEITSAGFVDTDLRGIVGCGWIAPDLDDAWKDPVRREAILRVVRLLEKEKSLMGFSTHLLAIAQKGFTVIT